MLFCKVSRSRVGCQTNRRCPQLWVGLCLRRCPEGAVWHYFAKPKASTDSGDDETKFDEMLRVRLFNGLFATSDNILRNILVAETGEFVPIDENDMLGKRSTIFNASEPIKRHRHWSKERLLKVLAQMNVAAHTESMLASLETFGLEDLKCRLRHRIENYETVLLAEL